TAHNMEDSRRPVYPGTLQKSPLPPPLRKGEKVSGASLIQSVQGPSGRVGECFGGFGPRPLSLCAGVSCEPWQTRRYALVTNVAHPYHRRGERPYSYSRNAQEGRSDHPARQVGGMGS